jgi:hypothetical protein
MADIRMELRDSQRYRGYRVCRLMNRLGRKRSIGTQSLHTTKSLEEIPRTQHSHLSCHRTSPLHCLSPHCCAATLRRARHSYVKGGVQLARPARRRGTPDPLVGYRRPINRRLGCACETQLRCIYRTSILKLYFRQATYIGL